MANIQTETRPERAICEHVVADEGRIYHVTLCTGEIGTVDHVTNVHLTGEKIVLVRGAEPPATFARKDVYFVTCEDCLPPAIT